MEAASLSPPPSVPGKTGQVGTALPSRLLDSGPHENILEALLGCSGTQGYEKVQPSLWPQPDLELFTTGNPSNHPDYLSKQSAGPAAVPSDLSALFLPTSPFRLISTFLSHQHLLPLPRHRVL